MICWKKQKIYAKWSNLMLQEYWKYHPCKCCNRHFNAGRAELMMPHSSSIPSAAGMYTSKICKIHLSMTSSLNGGEAKLEILQRKTRLKTSTIFNPILFCDGWNTCSTRKFLIPKKIPPALLFLRARRMNEDVCFFQVCLDEKCFILHLEVTIWKNKKVKLSHVLFIYQHSAYILKWKMCPWNPCNLSMDLSLLFAHSSTAHRKTLRRSLHWNPTAKTPNILFCSWFIASILFMVSCKLNQTCPFFIIPLRWV